MTEPITPRRPGRTRRDHDGFRETLAAPIPNQTYRTEVDLVDSRPTVIEQTVRLIAAVLSLLLTGRLIAELFTTDRANGYVAFFANATDWLVWPFQFLLGKPPVNATGGFFDWPAVAAIVVVSVVAGLIVRTIRPPVR
jgi:hypothetical protein